QWARIWSLKKVGRPEVELSHCSKSNNKVIAARRPGTVLDSPLNGHDFYDDDHSSTATNERVVG
ncbi:hypothetical protein TNCV_1640071, partial [Trichonephila clavipes]